MAINTADSVKRRGWGVEEIPNLGGPKVFMWKLEGAEEVGVDENGNPKERRWIKCGPFSVGMVGTLRARGFREAPPPPPEAEVLEEIPETTYACKYCGEEFPSVGKRLAHYRKCEQRGVNTGDTK